MDQTLQDATDRNRLCNLSIEDSALSNRWLEQAL